MICARWQSCAHSATKGRKRAATAAINQGNFAHGYNVGAGLSWTIAMVKAGPRN